MIKCICFDVDDTLLDFHAGEKIAFFEAMEKMELEYSDNDYIVYEKINSSLWRDLELKLVTKERLKVKRFEDFLQMQGYDANAEKMSEVYLDSLKEQCFLIDHALEVVKKCSSTKMCVIATNGIALVQRNRIKKSGLSPYFSHLFISEEMQCVKPEPEYFNQIFKTTHTLPHEVLFVGDSLSADIKGASESKCISVWFNPKHVENTTGIRPDYEIDNLEDLIKIVEEKDEILCNE